MDGRGAQDAEAARRRAQQRRWQQQQTAAPPPSDFLFLFLFLGGGLVWNEYTAQCPSPFGGGDIREHETPDLSHGGACPVGVRTPRFVSLAARPQFQGSFHGQWHAQSPPLFIAVLIPRCIFQTKTNVTHQTLLKIADVWFYVYLRSEFRAASFLLFRLLRTTLPNVSPKPFER